MIPVNSYGYTRVLEKLGKAEEYTEKFGKIKVTGGEQRPIIMDPEIAPYLWGITSDIPQLDELNKLFTSATNGEERFSICPVRFSIGMILFHRLFWHFLGNFNETAEHMGLGFDETSIAVFCTTHACVIGVAENTVVGHLSYYDQNKRMKEEYLKNTEWFDINES